MEFNVYRIFWYLVRILRSKPSKIWHNFYQIISYENFQNWKQFSLMNILIKISFLLRLRRFLAFDPLNWNWKLKMSNLWWFWPKLFYKISKNPLNGYIGMQNLDWIQFNSQWNFITVTTLLKSLLTFYVDKFFGSIEPS